VHFPAEFTAQNVDRAGGRIAFDFCRAGEFLCRLELGAVGEHNVYNALAAASAAYLCGFSAEVIQTGLAAFRGAARRMEYRGELPTGAVVYDDYAHHPDEIRATLEGASHMGYERLICVYQPHTYSRTAGLLQEFLQAFHAADRVIFADIYAAREQNVFGVSSQTLADGIGARASYGGSFPTIAQTLLRETRKGDLVIVMGAGDINKIYDLLKLSEK
jgi:UDP-N-acetylmuramate--alanine ligase